MTQYFPPLIDPEATDGTELSDLLNLTFASLLSQHSGPSAPVYATAGTLWMYTGNPALWILHVFDGAEWVELLYMNPSTNLVTVPGINIQPFGAQLLAAVNRAQFLGIIQSSLGSYQANVFITGTVSSGLGWTRNLQTAVFTAPGYTALALLHGRMRHTQSEGNQSLNARIINLTTAQASYACRETHPLNMWAGVAAMMPFNTTPGVSYTITTEFSNASQDSAALIEAYLDVMAF